LVLAPCGDASGDLVESHDAVIGADVERLVVGPDDAHHAVSHECAVVLVVVAVVVVLLVEHDMGLVMDVCDHICAISFGRKLAYGTPAEVQASKEVQEAYLGTGGND
jgi:ABC-type uncharacterized transport system ATPase subunit